MSASRNANAKYDIETVSMAIGPTGVSPQTTAWSFMLSVIVPNVPFLPRHGPRRRLIKAPCAKLYKIPATPKFNTGDAG
ncbi:hypothetical protein PCL_00055 [Purpureocillium lilacinum]|uniref:Uncharacterized protein n=1 Tax=Purpureocillium lilacinum TaxID=33203 RepID=A0A2U3E5W9_PURLI|nr:hypothetical protein Purlil1_5747 [Purpureocillium lilacinum]PWI69911.1 hypothetical protein PCL_00055 [Purpureocillium lilacinum]